MNPEPLLIDAGSAADAGQQAAAGQPATAEGTKASIFPVAYDPGRKCYWTKNSRGGWQEINEVSLRRHLKSLGWSAIASGGISPLDKIIIRIQTELDVDYAGPLAGWKAGIHECCGSRILVTGSAKLIQPKPGEWPILGKLFENMFGGGPEDQRPYVYGWAKVGVEAVRTGHRRPGQALVLAGEAGSGKSLLQHLITEMLGGRSGKPFRYMRDGTQFNGELFGAEHLITEDEIASTDMRSRQNIGARIKEITVNETQSHHGKHRQAILLAPLWRLSMSLNDEPENLSILPPLDESIEDKLMLLKVRKLPMPMLTRTEAERKAFRETLSRELPAFLDYLANLQIPEELACDRFGVRHYHHPDLRAAIDDIAPETRLLSIIDSEVFGHASIPAWRGTAEELESKLVESDFKHQARALLRFNNAMGTLLGRLAGRFPGRIASTRTAHTRTWCIQPPPMTP